MVNNFKLSKLEIKLILLCCMVYFASYITRINYVAAIAEISASMKIPGSVAAVAITGSFITYGIGQLISGVIGDKINPRLMIFIGLVTTSVCNISVAFIGSIHIISLVWFFNGFAQALFWPPLVRMLSDNLSDENCKRGCIYVNVAASVATILVYIFVPICIEMGSWRYIFVFSALFGACISALWFLLTKNYNSNKTKYMNKLMVKTKFQLGV